MSVGTEIDTKFFVDALQGRKDIEKISAVVVNDPSNEKVYSGVEALLLCLGGKAQALGPENAQAVDNLRQEIEGFFGKEDIESYATKKLSEASDAKPSKHAASSP